jgi:hypothetical protein
METEQILPEEQKISPEFIVEIGKTPDDTLVAYRVNKMNGDNKVSTTYNIHMPVLREGPNGKLERIEPENTKIPSLIDVDNTANTSVVDTTAKTAIVESSTVKDPINESDSLFTDITYPSPSLHGPLPEVKDPLQTVTEIANTAIDKNPSGAAVEALMGEKPTDLFKKAINVGVSTVENRNPGVDLVKSRQQNIDELQKELDEERKKKADDEFARLAEQEFAKVRVNPLTQGEPLKPSTLKEGGRLTRRRKNQKKHMRKSYKKMHRRRKH